MALNKSLDEHKVISTLLHDVRTLCGDVLNNKALRNTTRVVERRVLSEGIGFLTKTLPKLAKLFDRALANECPFNATSLRFSTKGDSQLPRFLGEFFERIFDKNGIVLQFPCIKSVGYVRQICYLFYKYKLPYTPEQTQQVIHKFLRTEDDLTMIDKKLSFISALVDQHVPTWRVKPSDICNVALRAKYLLQRLFSGFDCRDIRPRHGPGVVATKQKLWDKFHWTNISSRITEVYPADEYFYASLGHVCDRIDTFQSVTEVSHPAQVILVPKDSRGPRLISCEPVDFQWIQQGLGRAIVSWVERRRISKYNVFFSNQQPNQFGALLGSKTGRYATLDLNEASDRVSVELVRLLFPEDVAKHLLACRTSATKLPCGKIINLKKFAPMGSALCFPVLALSVWAILTAATTDKETREGILVYGDDVIVPTAYAANAIEQLESFGLKVNRDKSCTSGFFRESCGVDAFHGENVTPVRFRTVWSSSRTPDVYSSWISYCQSLWNKRMYGTYENIVSSLFRLYGPIPDESQVPRARKGSAGFNLSLPYVPERMRPTRSRIHHGFQKKQWRVLDTTSPRVSKVSDGWEMLLRYFTEGSDSPDPTAINPFVLPNGIDKYGASGSYDPQRPFRVSTYTRRNTSMLVKRWR